MKKPKISFIIPTLNSAKVLGKCLSSIRSQKYPSSNIEIIVADGGSIDKTIVIAARFGAIIVNNPLKTAEAGKAVAVKKATGYFIALVDSDNILPHPNWLNRMLRPLIENNNIIGSEPIEFTYRKSGGFIERYSALIGANDPYAFVTGVYDRRNRINFKWTNLNLETHVKKGYTLLSLKPNQAIPTIGANGTIFRADFLKTNLSSDYLFDIDIISSALNMQNNPLLFAKTHTGIIHTFCESSILKFIRKQQRRLTDYYAYKDIRSYNWQSKGSSGPIKFSLYTISIALPLLDSLRGFMHKPDWAWFFHLPACSISLATYGLITTKNKFSKTKQFNRLNWQQ